MSEETDKGQFDFSRRKLLGSVATLGAAGAIGGAGTMAFFSDEENFANNQLVAGELDLKVDWEEHYSDWSDDEANLDDNDSTNDLDVQMSNPGDGYIPLPDPQNPLIWVANDDLAAFMENTAVDAYPDTDDDGAQDPFGETTNGVTVGDICVDGADTPEALDSDLRTEGERGEPLINLEDVKPGDFGELTLSFHLCDNPGYVWLNGELVDASENGLTEPEEKDPDEEAGVVELLDEIQTTWWYDDGDNVLEVGTGEQGTEDVDVVITIDESGSISSSEYSAIQDAAKGFVDLLDASDQSASVGFASNAAVQQSLTTDKDAVKTAIDGAQSGGNTNIQAAINTAQGELDSNGRSGAEPIIVLLSDGAPTTRSSDPSPDDPSIGNDIEAALEAADDSKGAGTRIISLGFGLSQGSTAENVLRAIAGTTANSESLWPSVDDEGDYILAPSTGDLDSAFGSIGDLIVTTEEVIFRGSLRDSLTALADGNGIPLDGDLSTAFDEINDPDDSDARECFDPSATNYIGFAWYLPVDHGNEVQSDSVSFDLGFYTEQCRHNDGSGMGNVNNA